jgi:hypothetical protein
MGSPFASGKKSIGLCDRCGQQFLLKNLQNQVVKQKRTGLLVCKECLDQDHPQLMLGTFPVYDPQALRDPRRDNSYLVSGLTVDDTLAQGSRIIEWNWNPVGGGNSVINPGTPDALLMHGEVGTVTVTTA